MLPDTKAGIKKEPSSAVVTTLSLDDMNPNFIDEPAIMHQTVITLNCHFPSDDKLSTRWVPLPAVGIVLKVMLNPTRTKAAIIYKEIAGLEKKWKPYTYFVYIDGQFLSLLFFFISFLCLSFSEWRPTRGQIRHE